MRNALRAAVVAAVLGAGLSVGADRADAAPVHWPLHRAAAYNWHANYAYNAYGQPTAMVIPPTVQLQTNYSWGVSGTRLSRVNHQFGRNYPGVGPFGGPFRNTPVWPQDTMQFGIYNVRGPW